MHERLNGNRVLFCVGRDQARCASGIGSMPIYSGPVSQRSHGWRHRLEGRYGDRSRGFPRPHLGGLSQSARDGSLRPGRWSQGLRPSALRAGSPGRPRLPRIGACDATSQGDQGVGRLPFKGKPLRRRTRHSRGDGQDDKPVNSACACLGGRPRVPWASRHSRRPQPPAPFVNSLLAQGADPEVTAVRVNMPDAPSNQMRMLARLEARVARISTS